MVFKYHFNTSVSGNCIKCFQCSSTEDQRKPTGVWSEDQYTQNRYQNQPCFWMWFFCDNKLVLEVQSIMLNWNFFTVCNRYEDNCGVYWAFEPERNVPVECNSDESHTPGTFCVKIVKQGPRGFICKFYIIRYQIYHNLHLIASPLSY